MKMKVGSAWVGFLCVVAVLFFGCGVVWAQQSPIEIDNVPKIAGIGIGMAPDYLGSDHYKFVAAPFFRYQFPKTERYLALRATELTFNVVDHPWFRIGPALNLRPGRSNVDNDRVDRMKDVDWAIEGGGFVGAEFVDRANPRMRLIFNVEFLQDMSGAYGGNITTGSVRGWLPLSMMFDATLGVSTSYASSGYMHTYFGVDGEDALRSLLRPYFPGSGFRDFSVLPGIVMHLSKSWHIAGGVRYSRLTGDAADSPVVKVGSENQWIGGLGVAYSW